MQEGTTRPFLVTSCKEREGAGEEWEQSRERYVDSAVEPSLLIPATTVEVVGTSQQHTHRRVGSSDDTRGPSVPTALTFALVNGSGT